LVPSSPTRPSSSASAPLETREQMPTGPSTSPPCLFQAEHRAAERLPTFLPPPSSKDAIYTRMVSQYDLRDLGEQVNYGIGHLRPTYDAIDASGAWFSSPLGGALWLREVVLPLYQEPSTEALWGWVACGHLLQKTGDRQSAPSTAEWESAATTEVDLQMFETSWGLDAFIVLEEQPGNWYRLQITTPTNSNDGTFWISGADLGLSSLPTIVELWQDVLSDRSMLYLLGEKVHILYQAPNPESEVLLEIDNRDLNKLEDLYGLNVLEFSGDWMRVQVIKPYIYCAPTEEEQDLNARSEIFEGWMIWRTPEQGTQLFYPPRGC
ncbi:MAG: hypothetical protein AB4042_06645, partial [Leptolyngbyaceae cyanobacterium]